MIHISAHKHTQKHTQNVHTRTYKNTCKQLDTVEHKNSKYIQPKIQCPPYISRFYNPEEKIYPFHNQKFFFTEFRKEVKMIMVIDKWLHSLKVINYLQPPSPHVIHIKPIGKGIYIFT